MDLLEAIILGIIQGVTEWLPISSSGHLVVAEHFLGVTQPIAFDVFIQVGSVLVVLFVFWKDLMKLLQGVLKGDKAAWKMVGLLALASLPAALFGFLFYDWITETFKDLKIVGYTFILTAVLLVLSRYPRKKDKSLGIETAIAMGAAQALSILPSVSRSGATISAGMMMGTKREEVARFSFLMFIPVMLGAAALEIYKGGLSTLPEPGMLLFATFIAIVSGFFSLKLLLKMIKKDLFSYFSVYCLALGALVLAIAYGLI